MSIITITSDFGSSDPYLAAMKGELLSQLEMVNIIDISNDVEKFNIPQAAYILKNCYKSFPSNTVHLVMVGIHSPEIDYVIIKHQDQYLVGQDNGLFSLVFENEPILAYQLNLSAPPELASFPEKAVLIQAASHLSRGGVPEVIAEPIQGLASMISYAPVVQNETIRASVQYIDTYGNVITNLSKDLFNKHVMGRNVDIRFRIPHARVTRMSKKYSDVDGGDIVALFNSSGFLEIAINSGKAAGLLGIRINDTISINFV
jgi:S-adenosylmethionine hydrolase